MGLRQLSKSLPFAATALACVSALYPVAAGAQPGWGTGVPSLPPAYVGQPMPMRAGPDDFYPEVRRVAPGQGMQLFGCLPDRSWCDVGMENSRGWLPGPALQTWYQGRQDSVANLFGVLGLATLMFSIGDYWDQYYRDQPFYGERFGWEQQYRDRWRDQWGPMPQQPYWQQPVVTGWMMRRSWLLAGPDYGYPRLAQVPSGVQVMVYGCLRDWSWCDISWRMERGWVEGRNVSVEYRGRRQGLSAVAPYLGLGILFFGLQDYWGQHYRNRPFYREQDRWQQQYRQRYQPSWGPFGLPLPGTRQQPRLPTQPMPSQPPGSWQRPEQPRPPLPGQMAQPQAPRPWQQGQPPQAQPPVPRQWPQGQPPQAQPPVMQPPQQPTPAPRPWQRAEPQPGAAPRGMPQTAPMPSPLPAPQPPPQPMPQAMPQTMPQPRQLPQAMPRTLPQPVPPRDQPGPPDRQRRDRPNEERPKPPGA